jgi:hypothetical protein
MKVLFTSGDADNGTLHLAGFQGVGVFLAKPFGQAGLIWDAGAIDPHR